MNISTIDLIVFIAYCLLILLVGLFVSRRGKGETQDASNYFLAGRGLAWWAIGASIIASNISAEQFVGMSGSGYAIGLAMATYEWIAALGLLSFLFLFSWRRKSLRCHNFWRNALTAG